MILREETFEKMGYYPEDLSRASNKMIVVVCDDCRKIRTINNNQYRAFCHSCAIKGGRHPMYGKQHSEETKEKIRRSNNGHVSPRKGIVLSEETKRKISDNHADFKGEKHPQFGKHRSETTKKKLSEKNKGHGYPHPSRRGKPTWNKGKRGIYSEETLSKMREARKHRIFPKTKTKPEIIFETLCKKYDLPFEYTGDGSFWIGKTPSVNPDFVDCNGKKVAVEIFSYWHNPLQRHAQVPSSQTYNGRKRILKKYGWKLVVFWQEDLEREDANQFVLNILKKEGYTI